MTWTIERLKALSPGDRAQLYANALRNDSRDGRELAELIRQAGLPMSETGGIAMDDPLVRAMEAVVQSPEARAACIEAVEDGWPAIAGVDPLLSKAFAADYGAHNMTTNAAGRLVADLMRSLGYRMLDKKGPTPKGCIARSGELWTRK